jgi:hypothetical protein
MIYHFVIKAPSPEIFTQSATKTLVVSQWQMTSLTKSRPMGTVAIINRINHLVYDVADYPLSP